MNEPVLTTKQDGPGRPEISEEQYKLWLEEMRPHLELACSLLRACIKAGLEDKYYSCILGKYKLNDWFAKKVDAYRAQLGENINEALARITNKALDRAKRDEVLTHDEVDVIKHMSEKHRTAQPFFVNRTEQVTPPEGQVGKVLDILEGSDNEDVGRQAEKQVVATEPPIQNKEQTGANSDVPPEPTPA